MYFFKGQSFSSRKARDTIPEGYSTAACFADVDGLLSTRLLRRLNCKDVSYAGINVSGVLHFETCWLSPCLYSQVGQVCGTGLFVIKGLVRWIFHFLENGYCSVEKIIARKRDLYRSFCH